MSVTDTERLDGLQKLLGGYSKKVMCRWSRKGCGWRLHESSDPNASENVRDAIDSFLESNRQGENAV
jgi:hypothetical protein